MDIKTKTKYPTYSTLPLLCSFNFCRRKKNKTWGPFVAIIYLLSPVRNLSTRRSVWCYAPMHDGIRWQKRGHWKVQTLGVKTPLPQMIGKVGAGQRSRGEARGRSETR